MAEEQVEVFEVPVEPESLDLVQDRLADFWSHDDSTAPGDRTRFEMAIVEILANIIEHAFGPDGDAGGRMVTVSLTLAPDRIEGVLSDNGVPAELDLGAVTMPGEDATSGRGLALAAAAVDDLAYQHADGRNHWRLLCHRAAADR